MTYHGFLMLHENTPMMLLHIGFLFALMTEGGRFRWASVFSNMAIARLYGMSAEVDQLGNTKSASVLGATAGLGTALLPRMGIIPCQRLLPTPAATAIGGGYVMWHGLRYLAERDGNDFENSPFPEDHEA